MNRDLTYNIDNLTKIKNHFIDDDDNDEELRCKVITYLTQTINDLTNKKIEVDDIYNEFMVIIIDNINKYEKYCGLLNLNCYINIYNESHCSISKKLVDTLFTCQRINESNYHIMQCINIFDNVELSEQQVRTMVNYFFDIYYHDPLWKRDYEQSELKLIMKYNGYMNDEIIKKYIYFGKYTIYKKLVEIGTIIPCYEHLLCACGARDLSLELLEFILLQKVIPTRECVLKYLEVHAFDFRFDGMYDIFLNVLLKIGISLTKDDIKKIFYRKFSIDNYDYAELIDSDIFRICVRILYFPKILSKYKPTMRDLHYLFSNIRYSEVEKNDIPEYILVNITKCDLKCVQYVKSLSLIKFILNTNIDCDYDTIINTIDNSIVFDDELKEILEHYKK